jgi:hypothetical protein
VLDGSDKLEALLSYLPLSFQHYFKQNPKAISEIDSLSHCKNLRRLC